jgi:hypothetical protein
MNLRTAYQVTFRTSDGRELLVGYTRRRSRPGLFRVGMGVSPEAWRALGITEDTRAEFRRNDRYLGVLYIGVGELRFSGVTLHDVSINQPRGPLTTVTTT